MGQSPSEYYDRSGRLVHADGWDGERYWHVRRGRRIPHRLVGLYDLPGRIRERFRRES